MQQSCTLGENANKVGMALESQIVESITANVLTNLFVALVLL